MQPLTFSDFSSLVDAISRKPRRAGVTPDPNRKMPIQSMEEWVQANVHKLDKQHHPAVIIFRLLFPEHERRRRYGIQEKTLAQMLIKVYNLNAKSAKELLGWCAGGLENNNAGCLGIELCHFIKRFSFANLHSPSLCKVDTLLDELAACEVCSALDEYRLTEPKHPPRPQLQVLKDLFANLSPREAAVMVQVILRDLKPLVNPLASTAGGRVVSCSTALLQYNSNAYDKLELEEAMKAWHWAMPHIYKVRNTIDGAAMAIDGLPRLKCKAERSRYIYSHPHIFSPAVGSLIQIPKAEKGRTFPQIQKAVEQVFRLKRTAVLFLETKYDGERMQIHVDLTKPYSEQIRIFSKSKRDSTVDRAATHSIIRAALGLPLTFDPLTHPYLPDRARKSSAVQRTIKTSIILEAEMCVWHETSQCIDEFAEVSKMRISREDPAKGSTRRPKPVTHFEDSQTTGNTRSAYPSPGKPTVPERHLLLVFFDCLARDGKSMMDQPYFHRRQIMQRSTRVIEGFSRYAQRYPVDFGRVKNDEFIAEGMKAVKAYFARSIARREEGLMLKFYDSLYNEPGALAWIKLKKDYIPGLGDSASFAIVAVSWNRDRARELNVPTSCLTTYHIGLIIDNSPTTRRRYLVNQTVSYFENRKVLDQANDLVKADGASLSYDDWLKQRDDWSFNIEFGKDEKGYERFDSDCRKPDLVLREPLVFDLFGAGFERAPFSENYRLRFARVARIQQDRKATDLGAVQTVNSLDDMAYAITRRGSPAPREAIRELGGCKSPRKRARESCGDPVDWLLKIEEVERKKVKK